MSNERVAILTAFAYLIFALVLSSALPAQRDLVHSSKCSRGHFHLNNYSTKDSTQNIDSTNDVITDEMRSNDVSFVRIRPLEHNKQSTVATASISADDLDATNFGAIFRQCAPYIAMHSGCTMVIHLGGQAMQNREDYEAVLDDISILHLLGVKLVLVAGVRLELDNKLHEAGKIPYYHDGMRITDQETMKYLKETSGSARFEIESSLARGFRGRPGQSGINVVSGNFFYSAKPLGVRDGVDYKLTGEVRRIEVENLSRRLDAGDVVLLTSVGYCPSGEVFNVPSDSLAAECAARLKAAKIIYMTDGEQMVDIRTGKYVQTLRLAQAVSLLDSYGIKTNDYNQVEANSQNCVVNRIIPEKESIFTVKEVLSPLGPGRQSWESDSESSSLGLSSDFRGEDSSVLGYVRLLARYLYPSIPLYLANTVALFIYNFFTDVAGSSDSFALSCFSSLYLCRLMNSCFLI